MQPVPLTAEVLAQKVLGRLNDKIWIDWAYQMLLEGFETEHLLILAGMMLPVDHQELSKLTDKVLAELGLDYSDREEVVCRYVAYLSKLAVTGNMKAETALYKTNTLYLEVGYSDRLAEIAEIAELYYVWDELQLWDEQWYMSNVDRDNLEETIYYYFHRWAGPDFPAPVQISRKTVDIYKKFRGEGTTFKNMKLSGMDQLSFNHQWRLLEKLIFELSQAKGGLASDKLTQALKYKFTVHLADPTLVKEIREFADVLQKKNAARALKASFDNTRYLKAFFVIIITILIITGIYCMACWINKDEELYLFAGVSLITLGFKLIAYLDEVQRGI